MKFDTFFCAYTTKYLSKRNVFSTDEKHIACRTQSGLVLWYVDSFARQRPQNKQLYNRCDYATAPQTNTNATIAL
jgi:hypothetical protein